MAGRHDSRVEWSGGVGATAAEAAAAPKVNSNEVGFVASRNSTCPSVASRKKAVALDKMAVGLFLCWRMAASNVAKGICLVVAISVICTQSG